MTGYKKIFVLFFCFLVFHLQAKDNKDLILNNFFTKIRSAQTEAFPTIESIQTKMKTEIALSPGALAAIQPFINNLFNEPVSNVLTGTGDLKIKFIGVDGKSKAEYICMYFNSSLLNFVFTKAGDNIEVLLPRMGVVIKDNISEIEKILKQYGQKTDIQKQAVSSNVLKETINYIITNEDTIREKITMEEKIGKKDGQTTYIFNYPIQKGNIKIEIFDNYWTFASISFSGKDGSFVRLNYSIPDKKAGYLIYLPDTILLQKEEKGNKLSVEFSGMTYNRLFSENEFKLINMNFQEFTAFLYLKLLQR
ncbi:MAG: hypothetical protein PHI44_02445 [Candidatus Ratteibacteria bacterium]|nr:hypothetical protein [Candidatus Ratteibacteria bacterium]